MATLAKTSIKIIAQGMADLIKEQMRIANEVGLNWQRVFPGVYEHLQKKELETALQELFESGKDGQETIQNIFKSLKNNQMVLMAALDGVVLQTIGICEAKIKANQNLPRPLQAIFGSGKPITGFMNLKYDQQARYRELIVPGFINAYTQVYKEHH